MNMIDIRNEVETLLEEVRATNRYSMSKIYRLYNAVYERSESPQACVSCLIRKVKDLERWLKEWDAKRVIHEGDSDE